MRFAYADPPYLGCCGSHYDHNHPEGDRPFDGLCWDEPVTHEILVGWLSEEYPDGWALSCNPRDLAWVLASVPDARVAAWCKTWHQIRPTTVQYAWEPVVFRGGRKDNKRAPMVRDWYACAVARQRGVKGAKPAAFNRWVLDLLNVGPDDEIVDVFPGSGSMGAELARGTFDFGAA